MFKISMVIPTYTINEHLLNEALNAVASYRDQVDELIITEDSGNFSKELMDAADVYVRGKNNIGFTANVNRGWKLATGDFVMIVNSDTTLLHHGNLRDLCVPGMVTSPLIVNQYIDRLAGPFWCTPKEVTEARGMLIEDMRTYSSDSEYDERVKDIFLKVPTVEIFHDQAQTVTAAGVEGGKEQQRDREIYARLKKEGKAA